MIGLHFLHSEPRKIDGENADKLLELDGLFTKTSTAQQKPLLSRGRVVPGRLWRMANLGLDGEKRVDVVGD